MWEWDKNQLEFVEKLCGCCFRVKLPFRVEQEDRKIAAGKTTNDLQGLGQAEAPMAVKSFLAVGSGCIHQWPDNRLWGAVDISSSHSPELGKYSLLYCSVGISSAISPTVRGEWGQTQCTSKTDSNSTYLLCKNVSKCTLGGVHKIIHRCVFFSKYQKQPNFY